MTLTPEQEFVIGPQVPSGSEPMAAWYDEASARRGIYWAEKMLAQVDTVVTFNHYDLIACLYILFYRTGNEIYQSYARRVADKWFNSEYIRGGLPVGGGSKPAPMHVGVVGMTLYALDGHPEVFGFLDRRFREEVDIRLLGKLDAPDIYGDLRDDGYIFYAAVLLGQFLPDSFPQIIWDNELNVSTVQVTDGAARRAKYKADAELAAVQYFGRLQEADGGWRWRLWNPEEDIKQLLIKLGIEKLEQPFMLGIYLEAARLLDRVTTNTTVKENLKNQIVKACEHIYRDTYKKEIIPGRTSIPRSTLYFWPLELNVNAPDGSSGSDRHLSTTQIHAFGHAYQLTGDTRFIQMGDELWDSCFANTPTDGFRALMDHDADTHLLKLFTAEFRSSGKYLALRRAVVPLPIPEPIPSPIPAPIPTPTPQPIPTCVISGPDSIRVPKNGTGAININVSNVSGPVTVTHTGSDGQVQVTPSSKTATVSSNILAFQVRVKKQSRKITFNSPCGSKTVMVNVQ